MDLSTRGCGIFCLYHAAARTQTTEHLPKIFAFVVAVIYTTATTVRIKKPHTLLTFINTPPFIYTIMPSLSDIVPAGVVTGDDLYNLFEHARANGYAIPAVNCTRSVM